MAPKPVQVTPLSDAVKDTFRALPETVIKMTMNTHGPLKDQIKGVHKSYKNIARRRREWRKKFNAAMDAMEKEEDDLHGKLLEFSEQLQYAELAKQIIEHNAHVDRVLSQPTEEEEPMEEDAKTVEYVPSDAEDEPVDVIVRTPCIEGNDVILENDDLIA